MKLIRFFILVSCLSAVLVQAQISPGFEPGDLVVLRVGSRNTTLANTGDPVFLDVYTTKGILTNSVAIPDSGASSLIIGGTASSEGAISRSADSNFIVMVGYNTAYPYSASLADSDSTAVPRGIATIDFNGNYNFVTNTQTEFSGNNVRSGASDGADNFWAVGATSGTVYLGLASPPATIQSKLDDSEVIHIFNGNLCFSEQKTTPYGIYDFAGLPTVAAEAGLLFATGSNSSPYGFAISPDNTVAYVADDRAVASGGGIQKYTNNGAWGLAYTLGTGKGSKVGARGLAVQFSDPAIIYATTAESSTNRLLAITDTNSTAEATVLATAGVNEVLRGVQFTPQGSAPSILTGLQPQSVDQGQDAVFTVAAEGSGTLYYLWESNSIPLTGWETIASLALATSRDAVGSFPIEVLISNSWGTASSSATLTINSATTQIPPPVITAEPVSVAANAGGTVVFSVAATGSSLSYQWFVNSTKLENSATVNGASSPTLTLSNVFGGNDGSYSVTITNAGGETNSTSATLTVADPWIAAQPAGRTFLAGAAITLSVGAEGTQLNYQWTWNGAAIPHATNSLFVASNAVAGESGNYAVVISGTYGTVTSAPVMVIVAPTQTAFFSSNLAVLRLGDGAQTLTSSGNTLFLDQIAPSGAYVSSMALPDSGSSALLISGVATSEGYMTLSGDGRLLAIAGYNTNRGALTNSLSSSTASAAPRAIGTVDGSGHYTLATTTKLAFSEANLRSGATDGHTNFWGTGSANGIYYFGNTAAAATVENAIANCRVVNVAGSNLVFSTQSGTNGLYTFDGLPRSASTPVLLFGTGASTSPEDFVINSAANLAYVADDSKGGGIQRWQYANGAWTYAYTLDTGAASVGARSLTVDFSGAQPVIYAITAESVSNRLIALTDSGTAAAAVTLATSPANELYRAVKFGPASVSLPAPTLSAPVWNGGTFSVTVGGPSGFPCVVEESGDLIKWGPVQTNTVPFAFVLTNAAGSQFFRAASLP